jgi:two-component system sensor histidine kinase/response regulator
MTSPTARPIRIMLIADEDQERQKVIEILKKSTYDFIVTEISPHENLEAFHQSHSFQDSFDIAVCDIALHSFPLLETLELIRYKNLFLPVVILTSNHSIEIAVKAIQAGADDYIIRSARNLERLPQIIFSAIEHHVQMQDLVDPKQAEAQLHAYADEIVRKNQALAEARDKALEASRLKSEYLATMGHEIRTPMNAMKGMTELLLDTPLTREQREYIEIMRESSQILLTLINDILDFSKIEAGKLALEMIEFSPLDVVESASEVFATSARQKNLELVIYVSPQVPPTARGDPVRLRQVLTNLISNAIKFTNTGEVEVRTDLLEETENFVMLLFQIRDTGIGLTEESLSHLFQPFTQAENSTSRKYGGTGLGLAISRRLVELMDGEISVDSVVGKGSTFWFTSTFEKSEFTTGNAEQKPDFGFVGMKALIVDQNPSTREVINRYLEVLEMEISEASSPVEGLQALITTARGDDPFQVVVIGLNYPNGENPTLPPEIVQFAGASQAYLVLLTPIDQWRLGEDAIRLGFSACLSKPVKRNIFIETIRNLLSGNPIKSPGDEPAIPAFSPARGNLSQDSLQAVEDSRNLVLLAEDNLTNQRLTSLQLQKLGYDVDVASTGKEAIQTISQNPGRYMIVLMDFHMPDLDGIEATRLIREAEASTHGHLPIIAITASAMDNDREACLKAGMDDFVTKPVMLGDLHRVLQKWGGQKDRLIHPVPPVKPISDVLPLLDATILHEIRSLQRPGQPDVLTEMINIYLHDSAKYFETIQRAVEENDSALLKRAAHSLRGSSGNIGARSLAARCQELENLANNNNLEQARPLLSLLEGEYRQVCQALAAEKVV